MDERYRQSLLSIIDNIPSEDPVVDYLSDFVASYNGTNISDFNTFVVGVIRYILENSEIEVKARTFDKLVKLEEDSNEEIEAITEELELLSNPEDPIIPPSSFSTKE